MSGVPAAVPATKPTKAIVGAVASAAVAALSAFITAYSDGIITPAEWASVAIAALIGAGLTGGVVYQTTNSPKFNDI